MKAIKLLLAAPTYYPFYGGAEMRFRRYLPLLRSRGIESRVFTGTPKAKKITKAHQSEPWYGVNYGERLPNEIDQGIEVIRHRLPEKPAKKRIGVYQTRLREYISRNYSDIDVIQFLSPFTCSSVETYKFARKKNIPTIVACTLVKKPHANIIRQVLHKKRMKKLYSNSDCVVVSSAEVREYLYDFGVRNRIEVIGNGVDTQKYKPAKDNREKEDIRKKLGISLDKKVLLNVGSVHPRKGTDLLLQAFEVLQDTRSDVEIYIAGSMTNDNDISLQEFNALINELRLKPLMREKVHFLGLVDNIDEYMKASDVFVFPSKEEGMGNVMLEAMASGLPIVVTPYLGFPSVFGLDKENYLLADFSKESLAGCILDLLSSKTVIDKLTEKSLMNIKENLSIEKTLDKFAALYNF